MIKYPSGVKAQEVKKKKEKKQGVELSISASNRGMDLENDINLSNEYKVDYSHGARITDAYFEKQSTTDYNGVYKGKYVDFEAKNTKSKTSFPLSNIEAHQIDHLKRVLKQGGIAFFIIQFELLNEVYLLDAQYVIDFYEHGERKSIPYSVFKENGVLIKQGYSPRLYYVDAMEEKYFR